MNIKPRRENPVSEITASYRDECEQALNNALSRGELLVVDPVTNLFWQELLEDLRNGQDGTGNIVRMSGEDLFAAVDENTLCKRNRWNDRFEAVVCDSWNEILEVHKFLKLLRQWLKKDGRLFLQVENIQHRDFVDLLLHGSWRRHSAHKRARRYYNRELIEKLLFRHDFEIDTFHRVENSMRNLWWLNGKPNLIPIRHLQNYAPLEEDLEEFYTQEFSITARNIRSESPHLTSIMMIGAHQGDAILRCLDSIRRLTDEPYELIVVGKIPAGAESDTVESLEHSIIDSTEVSLIRAASLPEAMKISKGEFLLLLQSETVVTTGWLKRLQNTLTRHHNTGLVGPRTNDLIGPQGVEGDFDDLEEIDHLAWKRGQQFAGQSQDSTGLCRFCLLLKREVVEKIGYLSEPPQEGSIAVEKLCQQTLEAGYRLAIADDAFVYRTDSARRDDSSKDEGSSKTDHGSKMDINEASKPTNAKITVGRSDSLQVGWQVIISQEGGLLLEKNK